MRKRGQKEPVAVQAIHQVTYFQSNMQFYQFSAPTRKFIGCALNQLSKTGVIIIKKRMNKTLKALIIAAACVQSEYITTYHDQSGKPWKDRNDRSPP